MNAPIKKNKQKNNTYNENGFALILVLVIILALTTLGIGIIYSVSTEAALSDNLLKTKQALNLAESAGMIAYREFINSGFLKTTHTENREDEAEEEDRLNIAMANIQYDSETGDYVWEWESGDSFDPLISGTELLHGFHLRVYYTAPEQLFRVESEAYVGRITRRMRFSGRIETMFQFSYFSARDLGEFVRGSDQTLTGKIHSNDNLYVRPSNATLSIYSDAFTAAKKIIRTRDAWGRPDTGGTVEITFEDESGSLITMDPGSSRGTEGGAFDSDNSNWNNMSTGHLQTWGGVVRDKVKYKSPPPVQDMEPDGYYENSADLVIDNESHALDYINQKTFYNSNEQHDETYWEVDVDSMIVLNDWPDNGLIYAKVPIRIIKADSLEDNLMIVSCRNIYTHGNFNTQDKKSAAIMTMHRIYHLSELYDDIYDHAIPAACSTWINAALIDGAPTVDEYNWADPDGDHIYDLSGDPIYVNWEEKKASGFIPPTPTTPWANVDDLLENWTGIHLYKHGNVVHLCNATMCPDIHNSTIQDGELAWIKAANYLSPIRHFSYDPDLGSPDSHPPFTPLIGSITSWQPY